jgi:hypothetical protein
MRVKLPASQVLIGRRRKVKESKFGTELSRDEFREPVGVKTTQEAAKHLIKKKLSRKRRGLWEQPPKIRVIDGDPISPLELEILKELVKRVTVRKLAQLQGETTSKPHQKASTQNKANTPEQHIIHKAIKWEKLLKEEKLKSQSEIALEEGLTRARVTQILN